jgi:hypothetical protein
MIPNDSAFRPAIEDDNYSDRCVALFEASCSIAVANDEQLGLRRPWPVQTQWSNLKRSFR